MKACCFSGHRPERFPWGENEEDGRCVELKTRLKKEIQKAVWDGFTHFIAGGAFGADMWAAEIVCDMKEAERKAVTLEIALPFAGYNQNPKAKAGRQKRILDRADTITVVSEMRRGPAVFHARNRYMVDRSQRLIAVFDNESGIRGGTFQTLRYAKMKGVEVRQLGWIISLDVKDGNK